MGFARTEYELNPLNRGRQGAFYQLQSIKLGAHAPLFLGGNKMPKLNEKQKEALKKGEITFRTVSSDKKGNKVRKLEKLVKLTTESAYNLDKYNTFKDAILEWIKNPFELGDIEDGVEGGIQNASEIEETQSALVRRTAKQLYRYLADEEKLQRNLKVARNLTFHIGSEEYYQSPDAICIDTTNRIIETIRYKSSAATGMTKGIDKLTNIEFGKLEKFYPLYADRCYALCNMEILCPEFLDGENYTIVSSYYFMKKTTDKQERFDMDFFEGGGNSIVSINEIHNSNESNHNTSLDDLFAEYVRRVQDDGFECTKEDCKYCPYSVNCNFTKATPKSDVKESKNFKIGTLSDAQQNVLDTASPNYPVKYIKVNAGAGSGKTYTMTALVLDLMKKGYDIHDIFFTSFTTAGVNELKERIVGAAYSEGIYITEKDLEGYTFDSFYYDIVSDNYEKFGYDEKPELIQADLQCQYIEELVNDTHIPGIDYGRMDYDNVTGMSTPWVINATVKGFNFIQTFHINLLPTDKEREDKLREKFKECNMYNFMSDQSISTMLDIYEQYEERLKDENKITFSHLQGFVTKIFEDEPDYLNQYGYKYVIVDEFQDTNEFQIETLKKLAAAPSFEKMIVVGDDAQAIYSFRDTTPEFIINFSQYIGAAVKDLFLLENRRSTPEILNLANNLVAINKERVIKDLIPVRESGKPVYLQGFHSKSKEREFIVDEIERLINAGRKPSDICVITKTRGEGYDIGTRLSDKNIPWISKNPLNLLANSKVKAALGLCDAFYDPSVTVNYFNYLTVKYNGEIENIEPEQIRMEMATIQKDFEDMPDYEFEDQQKIFHAYLDELAKVEDDEIYNYFLELLYARKDLPEELEYSRIFKKYGYTMEKRMDQKYDGVTIVTAHSSKGLEWPVCFCTISSFDCEAFHRGSRYKKKAIEETRRVLFVALTRARDELYVTGTYISSGNEKDGYIYNQFLKEIYDIKGMAYDPIDHEKEAEKAAKKAAKSSSKKKASSKNNSSKSREMTEEEKKQYNKLTAGAEQSSLSDFID